MYFVVRSDGRRLYTRPVDNPWTVRKIVPGIPNWSRCQRERVHFVSFFCPSPLHAIPERCGKFNCPRKEKTPPGGIEQCSRLEIGNSALQVSPTRRQGAIGWGWSRSTQSRNYSNVRTGTRQFENETKNELAEKKREEKHEERENEIKTCHENEIEKENWMLRRSPQARRSDFLFWSRAMRFFFFGSSPLWFRAGTSTSDWKVI